MSVRLYPLVPNGHGTEWAVEMRDNGKILHREFTTKARALGFMRTTVPSFNGTTPPQAHHGIEE